MTDDLFYYEEEIPDIEEEILGCIIRTPELITRFVLPREAFFDPMNRVIITLFKKQYREKRIINPSIIPLVYKKFFSDEEDIKRFYLKIANINTIAPGCPSQFDYYQEALLKRYKEQETFNLTQKYQQQKISYEEFIESTNKLKKLKIDSQVTTITKKELSENIADKTKIGFNNFKKMNNTLKLTQGDFLIIGATTGVGKSGFMLNMMNDLMNRYQCIYFNMEMSKATIYKRLIAIRADVPVEDVNAPQTSYQKGIIDKAMEELEKANLIIEHKANDVNKIESIISKNKIENKHTIVFIDHLGLTKVDNKKNLYEQATEVAKVLRQICLEYDCTIVSASQLNRGAYNSKELDLSMLKDSGELENSASKVILLRRNKDSDKEGKVINMDVEVAKNRDGFTGVMQMKYDRTKQIFKEI